MATEALPSSSVPPPACEEDAVLPVPVELGEARPQLSCHEGLCESDGPLSDREGLEDDEDSWVWPVEYAGSDTCFVRGIPITRRVDPDPTGSLLRFVESRPNCRLLRD